jgi:hypothetical protein
MRATLLLLPISVCLIAQPSRTQWLGTWKLRTVTPKDDPAHIAKESTVVITERNGQIRHLATGTYLDGGKIVSDTGYMSLDGKPHPSKHDSSAMITVTHIDSRHELIVVKHPSGNGPTVTDHMTLAEDGKSYTEVQDVSLPDGKTKRYTSVWDKQ